MTPDPKVPPKKCWPFFHVWLAWEDKATRSYYEREGESPVDTTLMQVRRCAICNMADSREVKR